MRRESRLQLLDNYSNVQNVYIKTPSYNTSENMEKKQFVKYDDSQATGEFYTLDLKTWVEIKSHQIDKNRTGVGRAYSNECAKVFIQVGEIGNIERCKNYIQFDRKDWIELRQARGKNKHKTMRVSENGTIWIGESYAGVNIKIFVKRAAK
jgi:hypothetical protein